MTRRVLPIVVLVAIAIVTLHPSKTSAQSSPLAELAVQVQTLIAKLDALQTSINELQVPRLGPSTTLLYPFASNQAGFDTGITIANTGSSTGTCTLHFIGTSAPASVTTPVLAAGGMFTNTLSGIAPGFQGFIRAECAFPLARGWAVFTDVGFRELAAAIPAEVVP
jgi:hypothetical protein